MINTARFCAISFTVTLIFDRRRVFLAGDFTEVPRICLTLFVALYRGIGAVCLYSSWRAADKRLRAFVLPASSTMLTGHHPIFHLSQDWGDFLL